jgi:hypothetical protein
MNVDLASGLRELGQVADRLATLLEWEKLAQQERDHRPLPPLRLPEHNRKDILDVYGWFLSLSASIRKFLEHSESAYPAEQAERWWRQLRELEHRVQRFNIIDEFIKP